MGLLSRQNTPRVATVDECDERLHTLVKHLVAKTLPRTAVLADIDDWLDERLDAMAAEAPR